MSNPTKSEIQRDFFVYVQDTNTRKIKKVAMPSDFQIGTLGNPASLDLLGSLSISTESFVTTTIVDTFNIKPENTIILIDGTIAPTSGQILIKLPSNPKKGELHFVKDSSATAATNNLTISSSDSNILIDGAASQAIIIDTGSLVICWSGTQWALLAAGVGSGGVLAGAPLGSSYIVTALDATLTDERSLSVTSDLTSADGGAGSTFTLGLATTSVVAGSYTNSDVTVDAKGRITTISDGAAASGAPTGAGYIVTDFDGSLTDERRLQVTSGDLVATDSGPGANYTLGLDTTAVTPGSYTNVDVTIDSKGRITTAANGSINTTPVGASYVVMGVHADLTDERELNTISSDITITDGGAGSFVTFSLTNTAVTPGSYTNSDITVDSKGRITTISNGSGGGGSGGTSTIFINPVLSGEKSTATALDSAKLSVGASYFDPNIVSAHSGSPTYYWRTILRSSETPVSSAIDLYDINGIVSGLPGVITGSILSSSNQTSTYLQVDLTSQLSSVTGSGIFEARIWKTVSGSITSSITCQSANLEIEFS